MKITINIPRGFTEDIVININAEPLPFSDGLPNEELVENLNKELTDADRKDYLDSNCKFSDRVHERFTAYRRRRG